MCRGQFRPGKADQHPALFNPFQQTLTVLLRQQGLISDDQDRLRIVEQADQIIGLQLGIRFQGAFDIK